MKNSDKIIQCLKNIFENQKIDINSSAENLKEWEHGIARIAYLGETPKPCGTGGGGQILWRCHSSTPRNPQTIRATWQRSPRAAS